MPFRRQWSWPSSFGLVSLGGLRPCLLPRHLCLLHLSCRPRDRLGIHLTASDTLLAHARSLAVAQPTSLLPLQVCLGGRTGRRDRRRDREPVPISQQDQVFHWAVRQEAGLPQGLPADWLEARLLRVPGACACYSLLSGSLRSLIFAYAAEVLGLRL